MVQTRRLLIALCAVCAFGASGRVHPSAAERNNIGICLTPLSDYDALKLFADALKSARGFIGYDSTDPYNNDLAVTTDADGWPRTDAAIVLFHGARDMQGTYRLWFTTQDPAVDARTVGVQFQWSSPTVGSTTYDAGTNTIRYDVAVTENLLKMVFVNTRGGVKNVKFMRPLSPGAAACYDTATTFTTQSKKALGSFQVLRFMHCVNPLADNMVAEWADRTPPGYCCQSEARTYKGASTGTAWEYLIQLCNEVNADLWANIPFLATDDYIRRLATLVRGKLDQDRKVYVEYSNEVWNSYPYDGNRNHDSAVAEVKRGGSPLNFDNETNDWFWAWRRTAKRGKEISDIFRSVFGDDAMMSRVRPLLMSQQGNGQATLGMGLNLMMFYYGDSGRVAHPHPPSYYFYGAGGAAYYSPSAGFTADNVWTSGEMDTARNASTYFVPDVRLCATMGLKRIAYEGGPGLSDDAPGAAAWADNRITRAVIDHHNSWSNYGGDLLTYFAITHWGYDDVQFAFVHDIQSPATPKMRAIDSLNASARAPLVFGKAAPVSVDGRDFDVCNAWVDPGSGSVSVRSSVSDIVGNEWFSYVIRTDNAAVCGIIADVTGASSGARAALYVDGERKAAYALGGAQSTAKLTIELQPGLHGIMVRATAGSFTLEKLKVSIESVLKAQGAPTASVATRSADVKFSAGRISVRFDALRTTAAILRLCTAQGRVIKNWTIPAKVGDVRLPLEGIGNGVYCVHISGVRNVERIMVTR